MAASKLTAKAAIEKVLRDSGKAMKVPAIIEKAVPLTSLTGKNKGQTIYSVLYSEAKKGNSAAFKRVGKGEFRLNKSAASKPAAAKAPAKRAPRKQAVAA